MEEKFEELIEAAEKLDFMEAMQSLCAEVADAWEGLRVKNSRVTATMAAATKKTLDYLTRRSIKVYRENLVYETKLKAIEDNNKIMEELAAKIARPSTSMESEVLKKDEVRKQKLEDFSVVVTTRDKTLDAEAVKSEVKRVCKADGELGIPNDILVTKLGQIILKLRNKKETEIARTLLQKDENLRDKIVINVPKRRRERILILSVDPVVEEQEISKSLRRAMDEMETGDVTMDRIRARISDPGLDVSVRSALEVMLGEHVHGFEIVRKINTRNGRVNWLIDVDRQARDYLIGRRRICVDFERYRIVEHINIIRCFKCQTYGHVANRCAGEQRCAKCSGSHQTLVCDSENVVCANCYFDGKTELIDHRADSFDCPVYQAYRTKLLAKRL